MSAPTGQNGGAPNSAWAQGADRHNAHLGQLGAQGQAAPPRPAGTPPSPAPRPTSGNVHFPSCMPGCSAYHGQHKAGATTAGGGTAQSIGGVKANLTKLSEDIKGGDLHCGNFYVWLNAAEADLANRMDGSNQAEVATVRQQIAATKQMTVNFRAALRQTAEAISELAAKQ